jgi:hypothetical protein
MLAMEQAAITGREEMVQSEMHSYHYTSVFQMLSNYVTSYLQVLIAEVMNWGHSTV